MSLDTGTRLGSYEVVGAIGSGGMGEVYRARDRKLDRDVALKILLSHLVTAGILTVNRAQERGYTFATAM